MKKTIYLFLMLMISNFSFAGCDVKSSAHTKSQINESINWQVNDLNSAEEASFWRGKKVKPNAEASFWRGKKVKPTSTF